MTRTHKIAGALAVAFGALTLLSGGRALFGAVDMGAVVPFVLWFNFLAGFGYVAGGALIWRGHPWGFGVALTLTLATAAVFAMFAAKVFAGAAFEARTVGAMTLRTGFWAIMTLVARRFRRRGRA